MRVGKVFSVYSLQRRIRFSIEPRHEISTMRNATCRLKYIEGLNWHIDALQEDKTAAANSLQATATIHLMLNTLIDE